MRIKIDIFKKKKRDILQQICIRMLTILRCFQHFMFVELPTRYSFICHIVHYKHKVKM